MSIATMVDNEVAKDEKQPPVTRMRERSADADEASTRSSQVLSSLASYVPAEAIAAYLIILPFVDPSGKGWTGHWILAASITLLAIIYAVGYRYLASKQQTRGGFTFPWVPAIVTILAFAAWVFAIPDSPFNDLDWYTVQLGGAAGTVAATLIAFVGSVTGETLTQAKEAG
jgi:hypothetical protein